MRSTHSSSVRNSPVRARSVSTPVWQGGSVNKLRMSAIYVGGFIGPFSGQAIAVILPDVAETFDISLEQAAFTMAAYLVPFATVMLVSTRLVRNLRPARVIIAAYVMTLLGALTCILTPVWGLFLLGYVIMGISNAFTLPVLQVMLRQIIPPDRLGSALGTYAAMQSLGMLSAPLVAGVSTLVGWQNMFLVVFLAALWVLIIRTPDIPPPGDHPGAGDARIRWWPVIVHMISCLGIGFGLIGMGVITSLWAGDAFGLDAPARGAVIMCGGLAAFVFSRSIGRLADRWGARRVLLTSIVVGAIALLIIPLAPAVGLLAAVWSITTLAAQGMQMSINLSVLQSPGGTSLISTVQAFRFYGSSLTPLILLPIYTTSATWAFWVPALVLAVILLLQVSTRPVDV